MRGGMTCRLNVIMLFVYFGADEMASLILTGSLSENKLLVKLGKQRKWKEVLFLSSSFRNSLALILMLLRDWQVGYFFSSFQFLCLGLIFCEESDWILIPDPEVSLFKALLIQVVCEKWVIKQQELSLEIIIVFSLHDFLFSVLFQIEILINHTLTFRA